MLLTLLMITQVTAEWVEISQQHYRKPMRTHSSYKAFTTPDKLEMEKTTRSTIYDNTSVSEYNWNKTPEIKSNVNKIKRVQFPASTIETTEIVEIYENYPNLNNDEFKLKPNRELMKPNIKFNDSAQQRGTIKRVSNVGSVKRVQLSNSPVKSPVVNADYERENILVHPYEDKEKEEVELFKDKKSTESKLHDRRIYIDEIRNQNNTGTTSYLSDSPNLKIHPESVFKNQTSKKYIFSPEPTFITRTEDFIQYKKYDDRVHKFTQSYMRDVNEKKNIFTTETTGVNEDVITDDNEQMSNKIIKQTFKNYDTIKTGVKSNELSEKRQPENIFSQQDFNQNHDTEIKNELKIPKKDNNEKPKLNSKAENEVNNSQNAYKEIKDKTSKINKEQKTDKVNNMENLLRFMKVVSETIAQNSRRNFGGKMRYLHALKDSILTNIADRIDATWPDDDVTGPHRISRSAHATPRGQHVQFPSSESALMTISFLTFAVFLIKLVLQVVQTYKNKAMMVAPVMVAAAARAAHTHRGYQ